MFAGLREPATFEVSRGTSMRAVANALHARGWLDQPQVWIVWARLTGGTMRLNRTLFDPTYQPIHWLMADGVPVGYSHADLEPSFLGRVEELIDFVAAGDGRA